MPDSGKYIYCIADLDRQRSFGPLGIGARGDQVTALPWRDIAAVVSDAPRVRYRVNYETSAAHEQAIEAVFAQHTVLPVRFGTLAADDDEVLAMLELEHDEYRALLDEMRGKMEVGLKAVFDERLIYQDIVASSSEISRRREAVAKLPPGQAHWQLMEVGRMVEEALEAEKARVRDEIVEALRGACCEFRLTDRLLGERMIVNAAILVERTRAAAFEREVDALGVRYGERIKFKFVTGFPPFNFVCLVVHWAERAHAVG